MTQQPGQYEGLQALISQSPNISYPACLLTELTLLHRIQHDFMIMVIMSRCYISPNRTYWKPSGSQDKLEAHWKSGHTEKQDILDTLDIPETHWKQTATS